MFPAKLLPSPMLSEPSKDEPSAILTEALKRTMPWKRRLLRRNNDHFRKPCRMPVIINMVFTFCSASEGRGTVRIPGAETGFSGIQIQIRTEPARESSADAVVAVGGDGTVSEVAKGLIGTGKALENLDKLTDATAEEKNLIKVYKQKGKDNEEIPFELFGWIECITRTAYDWVFNN